MSNLICTFDSTFDGFLSVVYHTIKNRIRPIMVCAQDQVQTMLDAEILHIPTNDSNADIVRRTLCDTAGYETFKRAYYVFLCCEEDSFTTSYNYILYAYKYGKKLTTHLSTPDIIYAHKLSRRVSNEADRMKGFLRFSVMEGGVQYAPMEPENDILALLMPHFADKLKHIPFVIHDLLRDKAGVCAKGTWFITSAENLVPPKLDPEEKTYRELWQKFYKAVSIPQRRNTRLQTQMMPKKFRKHMTEHNF